MASIWAFSCSTLLLHINLYLCPIEPNCPDLICAVHQDHSWLIFELICAVYLEYIVTSNCVRCTHFSWPYMFSTPITQASKVANCVQSYPFLLTILSWHKSECRGPFSNILLGPARQKSSYRPRHWKGTDQVIQGHRMAWYSITLIWITLIKPHVMWSLKLSKVWLC